MQFIQTDYAFSLKLHGLSDTGSTQLVARHVQKQIVFVNNYPAASAGLNAGMHNHREAKFWLSYFLRTDRFSTVAKFIS